MKTRPTTQNLEPDVPEELQHLDFYELMSLVVTFCPSAGEYLKAVGYSYWSVNGEYEDDSIEVAKQYDLMKRYVESVSLYRENERLKEVKMIETKKIKLEDLPF